LCCASILKEAVKFDVIAALILYDQSDEHEPAVRLKDINAEEPQSGDGIFWKLFEWIDKGSFEVSADAFTIFRVRIRSSPISCWVKAKLDSIATIGPIDPSQDPSGNLFISKL
jgi:hypothetical protein